VYGSGFEGRLGLLSRLLAGRKLFGNSPAVVAAVRDPLRLFPLLDRLGIPHPEVRLLPPSDPSGWLVKSPGGSGGNHVRHADARSPRAGEYYQRLMPGRTCSALLLADGRRACVLGFNEQWNSPARPGLPYLYGGAVGNIPMPAAVEAEVRNRVDALVDATGLVGLNGVDFLLDGAGWSLLELNPRPTATMELYDPDYHRGLFDLHLDACLGTLPSAAAPSGSARASTIVHATSAWEVRDDFGFPDWCRDLPQPGTRFATGDPVCTVFAEAGNADRATTLVRERQRATERLLLDAAANAVGA
jgi:predicted ATP-grasp superfamily ATP-dependent carboligase